MVVDKGSASKGPGRRARTVGRRLLDRLVLDPELTHGLAPVRDDDEPRVVCLLDRALLSDGDVFGDGLGREREDDVAQLLGAERRLRDNVAVAGGGGDGQGPDVGVGDCGRAAGGRAKTRSMSVRVA